MAFDTTGADTPNHAAMLVARMERVPNSAWHVKARLVMGSATFFDAFNALSIAFVLPVLIPLWHIAKPQIGLMISSSYVGQLIGALLFSWLAERYGRVRCAAAATAIFAVMSLACAFAWDFDSLLVCRFIQGIGVGGEMPVAAVYISELSKARGRGKFFLLYEMIFPIGLMATGQAGALLVPWLGWKVMFLLGGIPGIIIAIGLLRLPESPRWLIGRGRLDDAEAVVASMERAARGPLPAPVVLPQTVVPMPRKSGRWSELLAPQFRFRTLVVWALWACAFMIANSLNNWMPTLYSTIYKLPLKEALRAASMTNVAQVALLLVAALLIDRVGRKQWMMAAFGLGAVLMAALAGLFTADVTMVIILATISYGLIGSVNAVVYLYTPEIYPTRMRAIGTGVATSWLRIASAVGPTAVAYMLDLGGVTSVFLMFVAIAVLGVGASAMMIETRDRRLEDIAN